MNYGHLELRIEELLTRKRYQVRIRFVRNLTYRGQISIDIAEMNFKDWTQI